MKKPLKFIGRIFALLVVAVGIVAALFLFPKPYDNLPPLKTGDLIFQSHDTFAALAISMATSSSYSHVGIVIREDDGNYKVLDSAGIVREWSLAEWVGFGHGEQFAVFRDRRLSDEQRRALIAAAKPYYGKAYDFVFLFDNEELYCSELPYLMYKELGLSLGKVQQVSELNIDNPLVEWLIRKRWRMHPQCLKRQLGYDDCRDLILSQELISPASITTDPNFELIYSNYWF